MQTADMKHVGHLEFKHRIEFASMLESLLLCCRGFFRFPRGKHETLQSYLYKLYLVLVIPLFLYFIKDLYPVISSSVMECPRRHIIHCKAVA